MRKQLGVGQKSAEGIVLGACEVTQELKAELDQWDKASDEAWSMISGWEEKEQS